MPRRQAAEAGYVLVTALIALAVMALLSAVAVRQSVSAVRTADQAVRSEQALYMANAGVEWALAAYQVGLVNAAQGSHNSERVPLGEHVGSYEVTVTPESEPDRLVILSTGSVTVGGDQTTREVTAEIVVESEDDPGSGDPDGPPSGSDEALGRVAGLLRLGNNAQICGDLYVGGILDAKKLTVGGRDCPETQGTGRLVVGWWIDGKDHQIEAAGDVSEGGCFRGGECPADLPRLPDAPSPGDDTQVHLGTHRLSGTRAYNDEVVYVVGELEVDDAHVSGDVVFVVIGNTTIKGDLGCADGEECSIRIVTTALSATANKNVRVQADLHVTTSATIGNNLDLTGDLLVGLDLTAGTNLTVRGRFASYTADIGNGFELYPSGKTAPQPENPPTNPIESWNGFSRWGQ